MSDESSAGQTDYWDDARLPLSSLCFLLPWIVVYEAGVLTVSGEDPDSIRNGADFWMRSALTSAGAEQLLLPLLVLGILVIWHLVGRYQWRLRAGTLLGMLAESLLLAISLLAIGRLHDYAFHWYGRGGELPIPGVHAISAQVTRAVSYVGAGVYEEVLFRLCLIPAAMLVFRMFEFPRGLAAVMAAISTSFLFAVAHHIGPSADAFNLFTFSFRAAAGLFFASIFLMRGFGITVGCHAAYDLLVGVILATGSVGLGEGT